MGPVYWLLKSSCFGPWKVLVWIFRRWENGLFLNQKIDGKVIFTWSFWAFQNIPGPGKYGSSRSVISSIAATDEHLQIRWDVNSLGVISLKRKKITKVVWWLWNYLMLHCDNEFRIEVRSFCFKFDDMVLGKDY